MTLFALSMVYAALYSFLLGFVSGASYDVLRILRIARTGQQKTTQPKTPSVRPLPTYFASAEKGKRLQIALAFLEDVFFCVVVATAVAILLYATNDGILRWYVVCAVAIGFFVYQRTLGRLVIACAQRILHTLYRIRMALYRIFVRPVITLCRRIALRLWRRVMRILRRHKTKRYFQSLPKRADPFAASKQGRKSKWEKKEKSNYVL